MSSQLQVDVFVSPPVRANTGHTEFAKSVWSPTSCTLIHGSQSALLVDAPTTMDQAEALAKWIAETIPNKTLLYIYTTHAHPDHFMGVPIIQKAFPDAQFVATGNVVAGIEALYATVYDAIWPNMFPGQLHPSKPVPKALPASGKLHLDGHEIRGIEVGHTDNEFSSFLHVPSLRLVISGDIVYGECHQYFGEANTKARRREWLDAIDSIEALNPQIIVAGHKRASEIDGAYLMQSTRDYIHTFEKELSQTTSWESLFDRMVALYPQRWNLFILELGCQQSFAVVEKERL
ncbi:hypothetical protein OIDMADRAFT_46976 [Oidiodendron maius Zn]|uniref:Metallo-beta-lactamase domain-containing protein n=1 Tax=Oidiodendron maius (strain Zn) TaxID=913774 RepID=A0A0C3D6V3_OIDMZ|nr:hypothetical protein OIDMADRAFT_46976 [Oidiodendron maius Zn]